MEITNPRRILALGTPNAGVLALLKDLTGSAPTPIDSTTAGLSHTWKLETPYYTAELPIWIDEIVDTDAWRTEFTKPEAKEVVGALGAWVYCFRKPLKQEDLSNVKATLKAIEQVIRGACGYGWDGTCLAVAMPQGETSQLQLSFEDWEEICRDLGFEYIESSAKGANEFGEVVGMARLKEALETTEWDGADGDLGDLDELEDPSLNESDEWGTFATEEAEMSMELMGMKSAIHGARPEEDEAAQVEELERMMLKLQAIKDTSSGLPEEEKKKFAAKAVNDIMKSF